jgi:protein required for attachment to host cells
MTTWIIVADSGRARIFSSSSHAAPLEELEDIVHDNGQVGEEELCEWLDAQGNGATGFDTLSEPKHHDAEVFARLLADRLENGRVNLEFNKLLLIATAEFLAQLQQVLNKHLLDMVCHIVEKDLVAEDETVIQQYIA